MQLNVNHLLERYYTIRRDVPTSTPLGRDPTASRVPSSDFSASIGLLADVGSCLGRLKPRHQALIEERWEVWLAREDADEMVSEWSRKALSAMRANRRGPEKRARKLERQWTGHARGWTSDLFVFDRRPDYIEAIRLFRVEVRSRDLYARGCCGETAGICGVS